MDIIKAVSISVTSDKQKATTITANKQKTRQIFECHDVFKQFI